MDRDAGTDRLHSHRQAHRELVPGQEVTAHWLWGDPERPSLRSTAAVVLEVRDNHVIVEFTEEVPAADGHPGTVGIRARWAIPHECWHPHSRVEPKGGA